MPNENGSQFFDHYQLLGQIGQGGMATVYKATDTHLDREVAIKVIRIDEIGSKNLDHALKRFEREARSLARLSHPNIVKVLDYGDNTGEPYLVMPYLPSGTLKSVLKGKPMPWQDAARILAPIAMALGYAHQQGIIHRDVKPSNILFTETGEPQLSDFGIAKVIDEEATVELTGTNATIGTPEYMAPEQVSSKSIDHRVDIYSLGVVFYEMLTGHKPFIADTPMAVMIKHAMEPLPNPRQYVPGLPNGVVEVLTKALAKKALDRYVDMGAFAADLAKITQGHFPEVTGAQRPNPHLLVRVGIIGIFCLTVLSGAIFGFNQFVALFKDLSATEVTLLNPVETSHPTSTVASVSPTQPIIAESPTLEMTPTLEVADPKGISMQLIPAGEFEMGSNNGDLDERPPHAVYLDTFYIDTFEVTNAMYRECVNSGVCQPPTQFDSYTRSIYYNDSQYDIYPVVYVTWDMAQTFCAWRGGRLPTEAEWEKSARGSQGYKYPWGNELNGNIMNFCDGNCPLGWADQNHNDGFDDTAPVNSFPEAVSSYGVYNLSGNVWEWVADWYSSSYYASSPQENPIGPSAGNRRVIRGGSWGDVIDYTRAARRSKFDPTVPYSTLGFRCAVDAP